MNGTLKQSSSTTPLKRRCCNKHGKKHTVLHASLKVVMTVSYTFQKNITRMLKESYSRESTKNRLTSRDIFKGTGNSFSLNYFSGYRLSKTLFGYGNVWRV